MNNAVAQNKVIKGKIFYGYWVVLAGTLIATLNSGTFVFGFGAFFKPIIEEFGWSRTEMSGAFSITQLEGGIIGPVHGWLVDKFGTRKILVIGVPMFGIGFFLIGLVNSLLFFYLIFIIFMGLGSTLGSVGTVTAAVANWFRKKQSTMLGITLAGVGLGAAIVPAITALIDGLGWRNASMVLGAFTVIVGLPLAALVRYRPEDYGYYPDNEAPAVSQDKLNATETDLSSPTDNRIAAVDDGSLTPGEALRDRSFWLLSFAFAFRIMATSSVSLHLIPFLTDIGVSAQTAGFMVSFLGIMGVVGRIGFGWLGDIFDKRYVVLAGLASLTIGMFILGASTTFWHAFLGLVFFSPAYGGLATMMFSIRGEYFGSRYFATIQGFMGAIIIIGPLFGPILAGWVFDTTGSYQFIFTLCAVMTLTGAIWQLLIRRPLWNAVEQERRAPALVGSRN